MLTLGKYGCANTDEFPENFQRGGGGVIFNPKIHVADFGNFSYYLALVPPCIYSIISIIKKLSRAVWNFSEKSSDLVQPSFPYWTTGKKTNILFHERMMLVNHSIFKSIVFCKIFRVTPLDHILRPKYCQGPGGNRKSVFVGVPIEY